MSLPTIVDSASPGSYDPRQFRALSFYDATQAFASGNDSPRQYLERCLQTIAERESKIRAFVVMNEAIARADADQSTRRWQAGTPLSPIDGMPIGIKDLLETRDMPTQMGCKALEGNFPKRDNAAVWALRQAGAVLLGKTVTAELGGSEPGPTRNPFDLQRTPGGSSSGSAAAVAAGMVPAAIGTQVGGSIIRPAGYCGNLALKPTQGAINRGERQATSMSTHGVHAGSIEDMWQVAIEIAARAGGDRGCLGLFGPPSTPAPRKPERLIVVEGSGWAGLEETTRDAFEGLCRALSDAGVALLRHPINHSARAIEQAVADAPSICAAITAWENRWMYRSLVDQAPAGVSERAKATLARAEAMSVDDYRHALLERENAQRIHAFIGRDADAMLMLSCPGPAPVWLGDIEGMPFNPRPTGDAVFNTPASMLFAPAVSIPMLAVGGMPVGVQLMGQQHEDASMTAMAHWIHQNIAPIVVA